MMVPSGPMAHFIVGQTGFAFASLETFFDAMFRLGDAGQLPQRSRWIGIRQIIVDLHDRVLLAVSVAYHRQSLFVALLTPVVPGDHASFDDLDDQRTFGPLANINALPGGS